MRQISDHTFSLARFFYHRLSSLEHGNGQKLAVVYSDTDFTDSNTQGAIVNFNLRRASGEFIGFAEVKKVG